MQELNERFNIDYMNVTGIVIHHQHSGINYHGEYICIKASDVLGFFKLLITWFTIQDSN